MSERCAYAAVCLSGRPSQAAGAHLSAVLGPGWLGQVDAASGQVAGHPVLFAGGELISDGETVVEGVADGRRAVVAVGRYLAGRGQ